MLIRLLFVILINGLSVAVGFERVLKTDYQDSFPKFYVSEKPDGHAFDGICVDIVRAMNERLSVYGVRIEEPQGFTPFRRTQARLAQGEIDLFIGMAKSKDRSEYIFLEPAIYPLRQVLAVRSGDDVNPGNFSDIPQSTSHRVLTVGGTSTEKFLLSQRGLLVDAGADSISANLKKLLYGRGRYVYFHDLGLSAEIKRMGVLKEIKLLPTAFESYEHFIAVSAKVGDEERKALESVLSQMHESGELKKIHARYVSD